MKSLRTKILLLVVALLALQCNKEREEYYATPEWVGKPIYEALVEEGRFSLYLKCVDKSTYLTQLKGTGFWTVFAPNDEAMKVYLERKGYASVDEVPEEEANKLVSYNLLYNKYTYQRLSDRLNAGVWDTLMSIRKRTPYYELFNRDFYRGDSIWVLKPTQPHLLTWTDRNYKFMPLYPKRMLDQRGLTAQDYELFFPSDTYSPFDPVLGNVQGARFVKRDMTVGNGVVHEVDYVNEPLLDLEEVLDQKSRDDSPDGYSGFKNLIESKSPQGEPDFIQYSLSIEGLASYQNLYPSMGLTASNLYVKFYHTDVALNCERPVPITGEASNEEAESNTLFAPNNTAIEKFETNILSKYGYSTIDDLPSHLKYYFINAHMSQTLIWPSEYKTAKNTSGVFLNGVGATGLGYESVTKILVPASNGFFFGIDDYVKSPYFETVYAEALLRPDNYDFATMAGAYGDLLHCDLNSYYNDNFMVMLPTDAQLEADGFGMATTATGEIEITHTGAGTTVGAALVRLNRLVRSHMFRRFVKPSRTQDISTELNPNFTDKSGVCRLGNDYDGYNFALNDFGDMVRFKGNQLQMYGNYVKGEVVTATKVERDFLNGNVYTVDRMLEYAPGGADYVDFAEPTVVEAVRQAAKTNPNISLAAQYIELFANKPDSIWNSVEPMDFLNRSNNFCTLFLPTNEEIKKAYGPQRLPTNEVVVPGATAIDSLMPPHIIKAMVSSPTASWKTWGNTEMLRAIRFFKYHIISGTLYLDDGYPNVLFSDGLTQQTAVVATNLKVKVGGLDRSTFLELKKTGAGNTLTATTYKVGTLPVTPPIPANEARVVRGMVGSETRSNIFGPKVVIHEIDGFLRHVPEPEQ